jgi:hypothetical protein
MKRTPLLAFEVDPAVISGSRVEDVLRRIRTASAEAVGDVDSAKDPTTPTSPTTPANSATSAESSGVRQDDQ